MTRIYLVAKQTATELIRDRVLHGLIFIFILFSLFSLVLGQLSFAEQLRITLDFSLSVMHLITVTLTLLLGSQVVQKEIERKTIFTVLARSVFRSEYLLGKFFGVQIILTITTFACAVAVLLALALIGANAIVQVLVALSGILLESMILLSIVFLLNQILKPAVVVFCGACIFLVGHWFETLKGLGKGKEGFPQMVYDFLSWVLPNLETWNWKALVVYEIYPPLKTILFHFSEASLWTLLYLCLALIFFERRELVS